MITNLHIKNIGIIEDLEINLNNGLNVFTGETGAGKTLIIDSLKIICGARFSKEMIRHGEEFSYIELCLYLPDNVNSIDGNIIVSREVWNNGRNLCKINGRLVTVVELKNFMSKFIEIHGQNENQNILDVNNHILYLDNFIGSEISDFKLTYFNLFQKYKTLKKTVKEEYGDDKEKERKLDLLKYQFNEISEASLAPQEEEELISKRDIIANAEKIYTNLSEAHSALSENYIDAISGAIRNLDKISNLDLSYDKFSNSLKDIYYNLQEISRDLSYEKDNICFDENELNRIEERLNLISKLRKKYGNSISDILNYQNQISQEIQKLENSEEHIKSLKKELAKLENELNKYAKEISNIRKKYSVLLSTKINNELADLEMKNATLNIEINFDENNFFETGKDIVSFKISTNKGEPAKDFSKIISGGEMSRIMLAIKKVLSDSDNTSTLIFDEIDVGISGKAANVVGEKMSSISKTHQVICISHLPNIAACADYNYFISKNSIENRTLTSIRLLTENETLEEIARISFGDVTKAALQYASELRKISFRSFSNSQNR